MTKPIFLFCPGVSKCGTTMMQLILSYYNTILHYGYLKEPNYLHLVQCSRTLDYDDAYRYHHSAFFADQKVFGNITTSYISIPSGQLFYPKCAEHLPQKISKEVHDRWFSPNFSVKNYIDFYKNLYQTVSPVYCGVSDFSTSNESIVNNDIINEVVDGLSEYFDIKCLLLFRDPVERIFSFAGQHKVLLDVRNNLTISASKLYDRLIEDPDNQNFYPSVYKKYHDIFKENLFIANEKIFSECNNSQLIQLSNFLNCSKIDISNIKPANKRDYKEKLTIDQIIEGRLLLKSNYDFYNSMFGIK